MSEEFVPHADWPFPKPEQLENKILRDSVIEWMVETRGFRDQVLKNLEADKL